MLSEPILWNKESLRRPFLVFVNNNYFKCSQLYYSKSNLVHLLLQNLPEGKFKYSSKIHWAIRFLSPSIVWYGNFRFTSFQLFLCLCGSFTLAQSHSHTFMVYHYFSPRTSLRVITLRNSWEWQKSTRSWESLSAFCSLKSSYLFFDQLGYPMNKLIRMKLYEIIF